MSSSESDDTNDEVYDDDGMDGTLDVNETSHLTSSYNSLITSDTVPVIDQSSAATIRSAFQSSAFGQTAPLSIFGDSIRWYVEAPTLFQSNGNHSQYYLSLNSTIDQSQLNSARAAKLFVGNICYGANGKDLKEFFTGRGFTVANLELVANATKVNFFFLFH